MMMKTMSAAEDARERFVFHWGFEGTTFLACHKSTFSRSLSSDLAAARHMMSLKQSWRLWAMVEYRAEERSDIQVRL